MSLKKTFGKHQGRLIGKIDHFFDSYDPHFRAYRDTGVKLLEIGVNGGGSLELWQNYFGPQAEIHGIDIDPEAAALAPEGSFVHTGSQTDDAFMQPILDNSGPFDIVIDDGSHMMGDQIHSFEFIYPKMATNGIYVCEDAFTSYWPEYGGGLRKAGTFMEYAKGLVDELHALWIMDEGVSASPFARMTSAIHFYSGAVVFQRGEITDPAYIVKQGDKTTEIPIADLKLAAARNLGS